MTGVITIRQATTDDLDTIAHLRAVGFGGDERALRANMDNHPRYSYRNIILAERDGRTVGTATAFPTQMWISGVPVQMGAVAGVTTHPAHREQGICRAMMEYLLGKMAADGMAISVLFPVSQSLYQKFGYANVAVWHAYSILPDNLLRFPEAAAVRPFSPDDLAMVRSIYRGGQLSQADGRLTRSNSWWERLVSDEARTGRHRIVVYEGDEGVSGYLKYDLDEEKGRAVLKINEIFVSSEAAYRGLWGYLANQPNIFSIDYLAPADDPILHLLKIPGDRHGGNRGWVFDDIYHATASIMLRVIDPVEALTSRFYPHNMMGNRVFKISDPNLPQNETLFNFRIVDGRPDTIPVEGKPPQVETDIATFSQLFCGFMTPEAAHRLGRLQADDETVLWLSRAMATRPLFIHKGDWF